MLNSYEVGHSVHNHHKDVVIHEHYGTQIMRHKYFENSLRSILIVDEHN